MTTRSGRIYGLDGILCSCGDGTYASNLFGGVCSLCIRVTHPHLIKCRPTVPDDLLEEWVEERTVSSEDEIFKLLARVIDRRPTMSSLGHQVALITALLRHIRDRRRGITSEQAAQLLAQLNDPDRFSHIIPPYIVDRWNMDRNLHTMVGFCYYENPRPVSFPPPEPDLRTFHDR